MIANHLWQSTLFAVAVWLTTLTLRKNRAVVRHRLWLAASLKFLIPFSFLAGVAHHISWPTPQISRPSAVPAAIVRFHEPFATEETTGIPTTASAAAKPYAIGFTLGVFWFLGFGISIGLWASRWLQVRQWVRSGTPLDIKLPIPVMSCPQRIEPGVFGIFKPILLLPDGLAEQLSGEQFETVLSHEMAHVLRRDNLTTSIHMFVEALFWFHPMIRWIKSRLLEEQERACDEEVLRRGSDPKVYAESILKICEFYVASPLACVPGIAGGTALKTRIAEIVRNRKTHRLNWQRMILLAGAAAVAVALPILIGVLQGSTAPSVSVALSQSAGQGSREAFEAASIRPSDPSAVPPPGSRGGGASPCGSGAVQIDPEHLTIPNATLFSLIGYAYGQNSCMRWSKYGLLSGGPSWVRTEKFTVQAVMPAGFPSYRWMDVMEGKAPTLQSMLRTLLEDRFKLVMRRETKEVPVYELTVAKGGAKLDWTGETNSEGIRRMKDGDCLNVSPTEGLQDLLRQNKTFCGSRVLTFAGTPIRSWLLTMTGVTFPQLTSMIEISLDRPLVDKSGLDGSFNMRMTFAIDEHMPLPSGMPNDLVVDADPGAPSLFTALQEKLGLKLQPAKDPVDMLVIDHAERPVQ